MPADDRAHLADLLTRAAAELADAPPEPSPWTLLAVPVVAGRLHLGRHRARVAGDGGRVAVAVAFDGACWLGPDDTAAPPLGRLVHRTAASADARGRVQLDRKTRVWLAPPDPAAFGVLLLPADHGLYVVPVDGFDRRWDAARRAA